MRRYTGRAVDIHRLTPIIPWSLHGLIETATRPALFSKPHRGRTTTYIKVWFVDG